MLVPRREGRELLQVFLTGRLEGEGQGEGGKEGKGGKGGGNLFLEIFKLLVFLLAVVFYFLLGFVFGVLDAFGAVCGLEGRRG